MAGSAIEPEVAGLPLVRRVEDELRAFFDTRRPEVAELSPVFADAVDRLEHLVLVGGKRIRPLFAWTGWIGAGGTSDGPEAVAVLRACAALELVQACALVHDDIIDSSETRRGHPTLHVSFADTHRDSRWFGDAAHFGASVAILVGDLALSWADDMFRDAVRGLGTDPGTAARASGVWSAMRTEVLGGQLLDIWTEASGAEDVASAQRINRYKTAAYTVERPLHLGAALAGAPAELVEAYGRYGVDVGIAFQLRDDLLGVFGDPSVTGKPSGDDLREGKRTVLFASALHAADATDPDAALLLRESLGRDLDDEEVAVLRTVIRDLGAVDAVEGRIAAHATAAREVLDTPLLTEEGRRMLLHLVDVATARSR